MAESITPKKRVDWLISELKIVGGAETMVTSCAPRLRAAGWDLRIITLVSGGELLEKLRRNGVPVLELGHSQKSVLSSSYRLIKDWKGKPPDLVHTHLFHAGILGRIIARLAGVPVVIVHQHGPELDRTSFRSLLDRWTSGLVSRYLTSCQAVAEILHQREHINISQIDVVYNGVDTSAINVHHRPIEWPGQDGLTTIVTAGRLSPEKGHRTLIDSLAMIRKLGFDFQCLIFGDGETRDEILALIHHYDLDQIVFWMGQRLDIQDWLPFCDIFVLPSAWEGISMALLEAMAAGLPVVATDTGGTNEVLQEGVSGFLVPPGDAISLCKALIEMLISADLRMQMGQAGKMRVLDGFRLEDTIDNFVTLYSKLLLSK